MNDDIDRIYLLSAGWRPDGGGWRKPTSHHPGAVHRVDAAVSLQHAEDSVRLVHTMNAMLDGKHNSADADMLGAIVLSAVLRAARKAFDESTMADIVNKVEELTRDAMSDPVKRKSIRAWIGAVRSLIAMFEAP